MWVKTGETLKLAGMGRSICLLDLNYTLVANSDALQGRPIWSRFRKGGDRPEEYRLDIVAALTRPDIFTVLITARPPNYQTETLAGIAAKCGGWQPDISMFNRTGDQPHVWKEDGIRELFASPKFGPDRCRYWGLESNSKTRAMYVSYGIPCWHYTNPDWRKFVAGESVAWPEAGPSGSWKPPAEKAGKVPAKPAAGSLFGGV